MEREAIRDYWDARAEENPFYFIDNRLSYSESDIEQFWQNGEDALSDTLDLVGAELRPEDQVVEIGCGVGRLTRAIAARAQGVTAIDVSERMIEGARELNEHLSNVEWRVGDGSSLQPLADESADCCISVVVFQHIPDPAITLSYVEEMVRVLRPGGWAAFQISNDPGIHARRPLSERLGTKLRALLGRGPRGQTHPAWMGSAVDLADLRETARKRGASIERVEGEGTQFCFVLMRKA